MFYQEICSDDTLLTDTVNNSNVHISKEAFTTLALKYWYKYIEPTFEELRRKGASDKFIEQLKYQESATIDYIYSTYSHLPLHHVPDTVNYMRQKGTTINDPCEKNQTTFPLDSLLLVILIASVYGCHDAPSIATFYKENLLELQVLFHSLPTIDILLTESTINTVFDLVQQEDIELLFSTYLTMPCLSNEELITYNNDTYKNESLETKETLGFDGQEIRSNFQKGKASRAKKCGLIVTLQNCSKRYSQAYTGTDTKKHESLAFIDMVKSISIQDTVVVADAVNTDVEVTNLIVKKGADYLLPIKQTRGNKELLNHVEATFNRKHQHTLKTQKVFKDHDHIKELSIEIVEAAANIDKQSKNPHSNIHTFVKYTKRVSPMVDNTVIDKKITETTHYYISSLPYLGKHTLYQVWNSIGGNWFIEDHYFFDEDMFNQDQLQEYNPNTPSNHAGFNKITRNILTNVRQLLNNINRTKTPVTYKSTQMYIDQQPICKTFSLIQMYFTCQYKKCDIAPL